VSVRKGFGPGLDEEKKMERAAVKTNNSRAPTSRLGCEARTSNNCSNTAIVDRELKIKYTEMYM